MDYKQIIVNKRSKVEAIGIVISKMVVICLKAYPVLSLACLDHGNGQVVFKEADLPKNKKTFTSSRSGLQHLLAIPAILFLS